MRYRNHCSQPKSPLH